MKSNPSHHVDHPAWQQAWRLRCCPPDHLLIDPPDVHLREHLEICPWCRETLELPPCPLPELPVSETATATPAPGSLYTLDTKLCGWGPKGRYYNSPIVLILACPDAEAVFVCQTYGDPDLAGPDDVDLGPGFCGFAQPWNCYTLRRSDLAAPLGDVGADTVAAITAQSKEEGYAPQPGSLLWFFRQLEVETGYFFSSQAVAQLMTGRENRAVALLAQTSTTSILRDLQCLPVRLANASTTETAPIELLFHAEPDSELLPLAAADTETTQALVFTQKQDRLTAAEILPLTISLRDYAEGLLTVTGSVDAPLAGPLEWHFRWQAEQQFIKPLPDRSGHEGPYFWATFALSAQQILPPAHLVVRILNEEQE